MVLSLSAGDNYIGAFPGTTQISISDYYSSLNYVWHYVSGRDFYLWHLQGSPFNAYTHFIPGSSYNINCKTNLDINIP